VSLSREWRLEVVLAASDLISLGFSEEVNRSRPCNGGTVSTVVSLFFDLYWVVATD